MPRDVVDYCELCGNVIEGRGIERLIEGTTMIVCSKCARFGEAPKRSPPVTTTTSITPVRRRKKRTTRTPTSKSRRKKVSIPSPEKFFSLYEVVEDYSTVIRKAREKMELTQEELGQELNEKVSVIQKIETGRVKPTDPKFIIRLEHTLDIKIHKPIEKEEYTPPTTKGKDFTTLGEVVTFRKKKKDEE
ncbi:MAG: multiprotein bridging factor aMBF1 [Promethearchaeota archaeon]